MGRFTGWPRQSSGRVSQFEACPENGIHQLFLKDMKVYTIGHSNHSWEVFRDLLLRHGIGAVADVRSAPVSRHVPHFNREALEESLRVEGICYVFLGRELGARPEDPACYENGVALYERIERMPEFEKGIQRVMQGAAKMKVALMCAEKDPIDCHRTVMVAKVLHQRGVEVDHILSDGTLEAQERVLARMADEAAESKGWHFEQVSPEEAYRARAGRIQYREPAIGTGVREEPLE